LGVKPTTARCLARLRQADGGWISGNFLFQVGGTRYGARLFELRGEGFVIEKRPAPNGSHVPEYRLVEERQLTLDDVVAA
jgi:hypothetical protein